MLLVVLNFIFYLLTLWIVFRKRKRVTLGIFLLSCYTAVAFFCILNYNLDPDQWNLNVIFFVYLYFAVLLLLKPFIDHSYDIHKGSIIANVAFYKNVAWCYIVLATIACVAYYPVARDAILNPDWASLYKDAHEETEGTIFTKLANMFFHLRFLGVTLLFFFLSQKGSGVLLRVALGIMVVLPLCLVTISNASRGGFIEIFVVFIVAYIMFRESIPLKYVRALKIFAGIVVPSAFIYLSAVTIARFEGTGYAETIADTIIIYLGHSMLTFVYGVADTINKFAWGGYMFGFEDASGSGNGTHFGSGFTTIIGNLYWDFGPVLSILLILLINKFWNKLARRKMGIPEIFLVLTYSMILYRGIFVLGKGWGVQYVEAFIIYFLLRHFQGKKKKVVVKA